MDIKKWFKSNWYKLILIIVGVVYLVTDFIKLIPPNTPIWSHVDYGLAGMLILVGIWWLFKK